MMASPCKIARGDFQPKSVGRYAVSVRTRKRGAQLMRQHRLDMFERTFDKYLAGDVPIEYLQERADKLKQIMPHGRIHV